MFKKPIVLKVAVFSILNLLAFGSKVAGTSISTALFLKEFGVSYLPYIFLIASITLIISSQILFKLTKRYSFSFLLGAGSLLLGVILIGFWIWLHFELPYHSSLGIFLLAIFSEFSAFIIVTLLWNLLSEYFDIESGKRYFHIMTAIGTVGGLISGFSISFFAQFGIIHLLLFWVLILFLFTPFVMIIAYYGKSNYHWTPIRGVRTSDDFSFIKQTYENIKALSSEKFLVYLILSVNFATLMIYSLDFLSNKIFNDAFPTQEELVYFLGMFKGISNGVILLVQFFFFPFITRRLGIGNSVMIFPGSTVVSSMLLLLFPGLAIGVVAGFIRSQFKDVFYQLMNDLLINILSYEEKARIRTTIKGFVKAESAMLASGIILLFNSIINYTGVAILAVTGSIGYIYIGYKLKVHYVDYLKKSMLDKDKSERDRQSKTLNLDSLTPEHFTDIFNKAPDNLASYFLNNSPHILVDFHQPLKDQYLKRDQQTQVAIVSHIAQNPTQEDKDFLDMLIQSQNEEIITTIIAKSKGHYDTIASDIMLSILNNRDSSVIARTQALIYLQEVDVDHKSSDKEQLVRQLIESEDENDHRLLMDMATELQNKELLDEIYHQLEDKPALIERWLYAMGQQNISIHDEFLYHYLKLFQTTKGAVRKTILNLLELCDCSNIYRVLWGEFWSCNSKEQIILLTIGRGQQLLEAEDILKILLNLESALELFIESSKSRLVFSEMNMEKKLLDKVNLLLWGEAENQVGLILGARRYPSMELLNWVLAENVKNIFKKLIAWEVILYMPLADYKSLVENLTASNHELFAKAMEVYENVAPYSSVVKIHKLSDYLSDESNYASIIKAGPKHDYSQDELLKELVMKSPYIWIRTVSLYTMAILRDKNKKDIVILTDILMNQPRRFKKDRFFAESIELYKGRSTDMLSVFDKMLILHGVPFFSELSSNDLKLISDISEEVHFKKKDLMIKAGEMGNELYILFEGEVLVERGEYKTHLKPPSHIGEISILSGRERTANVTAVEAAKTLSIKGNRFRSLIIEFPHIIFPIIRIMMDRVNL